MSLILYPPEADPADTGVELAPGTYDEDADLTIGTAGVPLVIVPGVLLKPPAGRTYTIAGRVNAGFFAWIDVSGGGAIQFGTGSITEALTEWFGASPAASAATNRAAIQATHDALQEGMAMRTLSGVFEFNDEITVSTPGVRWTTDRAHRVDSGGTPAPYAGGTILKKVGDFHGVVVTGERCGIDGLNVQGAYDYAGGAAVGVGDGIQLKAKYLSVRNVVSVYNGRNGVSVLEEPNNVHFGEFANWLVEYNGQHGVWIGYTENASKVNFNLYANIRAGRNKADGFRVDGGSYATWIMCEASYNAGYGMQFTGGMSSSLVGCHTEGNYGGNGTVDAGDGVYINNVARLRFFGGTFTDGGSGTDVETGIKETTTVDEQSIRILQRVTSYARLVRGTSTIPLLQLVASGLAGLVGRVAGLTTRLATTTASYTGGLFMEQVSGSPAAFRTFIRVPTSGTPDGVDTIAADPAPASEEAGMFLLVNRSGTIALTRVKLGATGTGPGGVGRALFVDNS